MNMFSSYRPQTIVALGRDTGRIITEEDILDGKDVEGALLTASAAAFHVSSSS